MAWFTFWLLVMLAALSSGQETCLSVDEDPYLYFGSKTAYIFANRGIPVNKIHDIIGCQPIAFWLVNRHGSHNPEANEIQDLQRLSDLRNNILANYQNGNYRDTNQRICTSDLNLLRTWKWNSYHNLTSAGILTSEGYLNTQDIAQSWKNRFPTVLTDNKEDYLFKFASDKRSDETYRAFIDGLFRRQPETYDKSKENDEKILKPYSHCQAWKTRVEDNNDTYTQRNIFQSKQEYKEMISNISLRLGFKYDIRTEDVLSMYQMCRYNKAWDLSPPSAWCAAFTKEDLKRLEYAEDLETYYKYGYGTPENQKLGCTLVKDMMNFFENQVKNESPKPPKAVVQFAEAPMLLMMLAALGSHHDNVPLTGDNYHTKQMMTRKWTTSTMAPYSANVAAILYKCDVNEKYQISERYQVLFLENEKEMPLEGCRVGLCGWKYLKNRFGDIASNCSLDFCSGASNIRSLTAISMAIVAFLTLVVL